MKETGIHKMSYLLTDICRFTEVNVPWDLDQLSRLQSIGLRVLIWIINHVHIWLIRLCVTDKEKKCHISCNAKYPAPFLGDRERSLCLRFFPSSLCCFWERTDQGCVTKAYFCTQLIEKESLTRQSGVSRTRFWR